MLDLTVVTTVTKAQSQKNRRRMAMRRDLP